MTRPPAVVVAAATLTAGVAAAAFAISFASLVYVGRVAGVQGDLAVAYPLTIDGLLTVGVIAAVALREAKLRSRLFVWSLIGAAVGVSVVGNMAHARAGGGNWLAAAAGAVPPVALVVTLELLVMIVRHNRQPAPKVKRRAKESPRSMDHEPLTDVNPVTVSRYANRITPYASLPAASNGHTKRTPARGKPGVRAQHLARTRELLDADPHTTGRRVGEVIKRDPSYGRDLLREVRRERELAGAVAR